MINELALAIVRVIRLWFRARESLMTLFVRVIYEIACRYREIVASRSLSVQNRWQGDEREFSVRSVMIIAMEFLRVAEDLKENKWLVSQTVVTVCVANWHGKIGGDKTNCQFLAPVWCCCVFKMWRIEILECHLWSAVHTHLAITNILIFSAFHEFE